MNDDDVAKLRAAWALDEHGNPPPLDPELIPHLYESEHLGLVLKHPLVFSVPYSEMMNGHVNQGLAYKKEALARAEKQHDWYTYLFLHERPYRITAFVKISKRLTYKQYWSLLGQIWSDTENLAQNTLLWRTLLTRPIRGRSQHFMDDDEREFLRTLRTPVEIYRGTFVHDGIGSGMSWTLDRPRAEWFARRFALQRGEPVVWVGKVYKKDIVAYLAGRNESEIIVLPEDVDILDAYNPEDQEDEG